ncbi:FtsK/SpoIIIE domain-containing protein [Microbacterium testaceum]|uniref:Cell division protein FtsK n=1 Tax=Microbacterium testaceum TaxID=2033 RepID=A0A147F7V2_MICTE|nr:FtsK/SpoIIIE domain-containing protein [Microbacterium testaceum]KTS12274.1 cell division protein FtsK [Microbacterium testaceum]
MRLLIAIDEDEQVVDLARHRSQATLGELIAAATGHDVAPDTLVAVDAERHPASTALSEVLLLEGTRIALSASPRPKPATDWTATLSGGLEAGPVVDVPRGRALVAGRSPQADLRLPTTSASWEHFSAARDDDGLRVDDRGSTNGTLVDGTAAPEDGTVVESPAVITAGGTTVLLRPSIDETPAPEPGSLHNITPAATAPFNRPPRPGRPPEPDPITPPTRKDVPPASKFSIITVAAPLVLAFAMVLMLGDARYALFAALSPVLGVGVWFEQKRRHTKNVKEEDERFTQALQTLRDDIASAGQAEKARRMDAIPDPATTLRRAAIPATTLWQRRAGSPDLLALHAGIGDVPWRPAIDERSGARLEDEVREILDTAAIPAAPVEIDLTAGGVVGIVGDRDGALALARSLVIQAGIHVGPADLTLGVFCDAGRSPDWAWAGWLPHTRRQGTGTQERWMSDNRERSTDLLRGLRDGIHDIPTAAVLLVLDSDVLTEGRNAPARELLGHGRPDGATTLSRDRQGVQVSGIVLASSEEQLPAACTVVVRVAPDAAATVTRPGDLVTVDDVIIAGIDVDTAAAGARDVARFDDPELVVPGAALPGLVRLPPLLGLDDVTADAVRELWANARGITAPIGTGEGGTMELDLVHDGPHGLVGGTTGSGKSEFLRSLVAGLALRNDPTRLSFILIDFKGGAAFAACERLPHTIGTISNLDEQLADRALRSLEAEMRRRQRIFAAAGEGVDNLDAYLATKPAEPMPRLLLVVDEFAMLAKDFPDVLSSLVSVAAVGRTLGVHMILATQRPAGVVNDDILANTNLRVALRVQSRDDSNNVIGVPAASAIGRAQRGRAYIKRGQDDIAPVQTALVTGASERAVVEAVELQPVTFSGIAPASKTTVVDDSTTDLDVVIDAIRAAADEAGIAAPRPVWPEALGARVPLAGFGDDAPTPGVPAVGGVQGAEVFFALADEPDSQRQVAAGWNLSRGNLLAVGIPGSGTSTALSSIALALAAESHPDDLDILVLDAGARDLAPLSDLPHTVAYVGAGGGAREQQARFLRHLRTDLERRRADEGQRRRAIVLIDGLAALRDEFQDHEGQQLLDGLYRAYADGPELGLHFAVSTTRAKAVPSAIDEVTTQKWMFRLADPYDYTSAGLRPKDAPASVPGRCVLAESARQAHVATPADGLAGAVARVKETYAGAAAKAPVVGRLPEEVGIADLGVAADLRQEPWRIPIGVAESDLAPAFLEVYEGEHVLVAGPARSGKSTLLLAIAQSLRTTPDAIAPVTVWGVCGRRSPLATADLDRVVVGSDDIPALVASVRLEKGPVVVLVDDAESFEDSDQSLAGLLTMSQPHVLIIAAGRSADLRAQYSGWTKTLRKSRCGVLLQPDVDYDGDLLGVTLPRRAPVAVTTGRGYACVAGAARFVQAAGPSVAVPVG